MVGRVGTILLVVIAPYSYMMRADYLDFVDQHVDQFLVRMEMPSADRTLFVNYYSHVNKALHARSAAQQRLIKSSLYTTALRTLRKNKPSWYQQIYPFLNDPMLVFDTSINDIRAAIGGFLLRYGLYQEFCLRHAPPKQKSFLECVEVSLRYAVCSLMGVPDLYA